MSPVSPMSIDYTGQPYNMWTKCPHTCGHQKLKPREKNGAITYEVDGETIFAGQIQVFHRRSRLFRAHATNREKHPNCTPACPGHKWLGDIHVTAGELRTPLSAEDWHRWGLGVAINAKTFAKSDIPAEYLRQLSVEFPEQYEALVALPIKQKTKSTLVPESETSISHGNAGERTSSPSPSEVRLTQPLLNTTSNLTTLPLSTQSQSPAADPIQIRTDPLPLSLESHLHPVPPKSADNKLPSINPTHEVTLAKLSHLDSPPLEPQHSVSNELPKAQPPIPLLGETRKILPQEPLEYTLTNPNLDSDPAFLLPPSGPEFRDQRPLYRVSVSLNVHPLQPPCYTTYVLRGGLESGETVAQFKFCLDHRWGSLTMGGETTELSKIISNVDSCTRHFKWEFHNVTIGWDCDATRADNSPVWICYAADTAMTPIASYVPPPAMWNSQPAVLTVSPDGHKDDLLDHIFVSVLIINRKLS